MRALRMGLAASSAALMPRPMTSSLRSSPAAVVVVVVGVVGSPFLVAVAVAVAVAVRSSEGGKWDIQLEQKSRIRPLRGRLCE